MTYQKIDTFNSNDRLKSIHAEETLAYELLED
jgi:hypothetical protein